MKVRTRVGAILGTAVLAGAAALSVTAPAGASVAKPAHLSLGAYGLVHANPLFDKQAHSPYGITPDTGALLFELKNDFTFCLTGEGAGNPVKTGYQTGCSTFTIQHPVPMNCNAAAVFISQNGYALRAKNDGSVILSTESNPNSDPNATWGVPAGESGTNLEWTNCTLGGVSYLAAAHDAVNSSIYARDHAGDWHMIGAQT